MSQNYRLQNLQPEHFDDVIAVGNLVHGDGYLDRERLEDQWKRGIKDGLNASYVIYDGDQLIGFRISYAPGHWSIDQWCTPEEWPIPKDQMAYFKCNTIHPDYQGQGIGGQLLKTSIATLKEMGANGGLSHIWMQSPGNASYKYFTKAGGKLIKTHAERWANLENYICIICGEDCTCEASEMVLEF